MGSGKGALTEVQPAPGVVPYLLKQPCGHSAC